MAISGRKDLGLSVSAFMDAVLAMVEERFNKEDVCSIEQKKWARPLLAWRLLP